MNLPAWRYYTQFYRGFHRWLILSVAIAAVQSAVYLPIALLVRTVFDRVIPKHDFGLLLYIGLAILALYLVDAGLTLYTRYLGLRITKHAIQRFRDELLKRLYTYSRSFYTEADRSQLHASVVQDTERLDVMTNALVVQFLPAFITSLALSVVLLILNWYLFLALISVLPVLYVLNLWLSRLVRERTRLFQRSFETFSKGVLFVLQMMDLTTIQSAEAFELERQRRHLDELRRSSTDMAVADGLWPAAELRGHGVGRHHSGRGRLCGVHGRDDARRTAVLLRRGRVAQRQLRHDRLHHPTDRCRQRIVSYSVQSDPHQGNPAVFGNEADRVRRTPPVGRGGLPV